MIRPTALLQTYLHDVRRRTGAPGAALFLPSFGRGGHADLLLHEGEPPPVELADLERARQFHEACGDASPDVERLVPLRFRDAPTGWIGLAPGPNVAPPPESQVVLGAQLVAHARWVGRLLGDPVTGLPGRVEFHARLEQALARARNESLPVTVLLSSPDDFAETNQRHGRDAGDRAIQEFADRLRASLGDVDEIGRYGGAMFATFVTGADREDLGRRAETVRQALVARPYLDRRLELRASIGGAAVDAEQDTGAEELLRRAEQALNIARWAGGNCVRFWEPAHATETAGSFDQLSGILTGNQTKDYRNMRVLTDTVTAVAAMADAVELGEEVTRRLFATLRCERIGMDEWSVDGSSRRLAWIGPPDEPEALQALLDETRRHGRAASRANDGRIAFAVPLVARDAGMGCLYLEGAAGRVAVDRSDTTFLEALGSQLAVALDRARLSAVEKRWQERERERLQSEVSELRQVLHQSELVGRSPQMRQLLQTAHRVAQTDATVLVYGESGTGKELLSRTVHDLSPRRDKPVVVVDCAAIPATLIESELFGHEKGAYTGAQGRKVGRLAEADGGTVILDEIGELPLEIQSKLLRFVQEKTLIPVGGNREQSVDARLVAATNRDLELEAREGRFREDLYHRLNVIRLEIPPLRDRPEDILPLTENFLKQFSAQYRKGMLCRLTPEAEIAIVRQTWGGNVRELRNRIMQTVILADGEELGVAALGLDGAPATGQGSANASPAAAAGAASPDSSTWEPEETADDALDHLTSDAEWTERPNRESSWHELLGALGRAIDQTLETSERPVPLGRWLADDLILEAHRAAGGVLSHGADRLGIPEATFRRRVRKVKGEHDAGLSPRTRPWDEVQPLLARLVDSGERQGDDLLRSTRDALLERVLARVPDARSTAAALMGVTLPTLRSWVRELEADERSEEIRS